MSPLKLSKLPDRETVKITFAANTELNRLLEAYAQAYEAEYARKETVPDLIPHMLEAFIRSDRGFRNQRTQRDAIMPGSRIGPNDADH